MKKTFQMNLIKRILSVLMALVIILLTSGSILAKDSSSLDDPIFSYYNDLGEKISIVIHYNSGSISSKVYNNGILIQHAIAKEDSKLIETIIYDSKEVTKESRSNDYFSNVTNKYLQKLKRPIRGI